MEPTSSDNPARDDSLPTEDLEQAVGGACYPNGPGVMCTRCSGSGRCWNCSGTGRTVGYAACYMCSGSGKCYYCGGCGTT